VCWIDESFRFHVIVLGYGFDICGIFEINIIEYGIYEGIIYDYMKGCEEGIILALTLTLTLTLILSQPTLILHPVGF